MTYADLQKLLEEYFESEWTYTPIAWDNVPLSLDGVNAWVRFTIITTDRYNIGFGTDCIRISGTIVVQIFTRYDVGSGSAVSLADSVVSILENKDLGGVITFNSTMNRVGDIEHQVVHPATDWYQINVKTLFDSNP